VDDNKEIDQLGVYLDLCEERDVLLSVVWLAFKYKEKHPDWEVNKCFEQALWDAMLSEAKKEPKFDLNMTILKIKEMTN
jgi:hypothetical protein